MASRAEVLLDFVGRAGGAKRELREVIETIRAIPNRKDFRLTAVVDNAKRELIELEGLIRSLPDQTATEIVAQTTEARARLDLVQTKLKEIDLETVSPEIQALIVKALADIEVYKERLRSIPNVVGTEVSVKEARTGGLRDTIRGLVDLESRLDRFSRRKSKFSVTAETDLAKREVGEFVALLSQVPRATSVEVGAKTAEAMAQLERLEGELLSIDRETVSPEVNTQISKALADIALFKSRLNSIDKRYDVDVNVDVHRGFLRDLSAIEGGLGRMATQFGSTATAAGGTTDKLDGFLTFLRRLGPLIGGAVALIAGALIPALVALGASLAAAIGGVAALANALLFTLGPALILIVGLVQRFGAIFAASEALTQSVTGGIKKSAAIQREEAKKGASVARASDAAQVQSARQVRDARQAITEAHRRYEEAVQEARAGIQSALQAERDAIRDVAEAERDLAVARDAVPRARADARQEIDDSIAGQVRATDALIDANRDLERVTVEAYRAMAKAIRDVERASNDLADAQLGVEDATDAVSDIEKEIADLVKTMGSVDPGAILKKLTDVDLKGFDAGAFAIDVGITGDATQIEKLDDLTRLLAHAKIDLKNANLDVKDSEDGLSDAIATNNGFVKDGINAYEPYRSAVDRVKDATADWLGSIRETNKLLADGVEGAPSVISAIEAEHNARERLRDAQKALVDAHKAYEEVRKQGVARNPQVIAAANAVRNANEQLGDSFDQAGLKADALGASIGGIDDSLPSLDLAKGLIADLSDAETRLLGFVKSVPEMFRRLVQPATDAVFNSIADAIPRVIPFFRSLGDEIALLGRAWGDNVEQFSRTLITEENQRAFSAFGVEAVHVSRVLGGSVFNDFFVIMRRLAVAALPALNHELDRLARGFGKLEGDTENSEKLADVIDAMVVSFDLWLDLVGSLIAAFAEFVAIVKPFGDDLVKWVTDAVNGFREWQRSDEGRKQIQAFFRDVVPLIKEFVTFLFKLGVVFFQLIQFFAPALTDLFRGLNFILGIVIKLLAALNTLSAPLRAILGSLILFGPVKPLFTGILRIVGLLGVALGGLGSAIATVAGDIIGAFTGLPGALVNVGADIVSAIVGGITGAGGLLVEGATWLFNTWKAAVGTYVSSYLAIGTWVLGRVVAGIKAVGGLLVDAATSFVNAYRDAVHSFVSVYLAIGTWVIERIVDGLKAVGGLLVEAATWLFNAWKAAVETYVSSYLAIGTWVLGKIVEGLKAVGGLLAGAATWLFNTYRSAVHALASFYLGLGSWIIGKVVEGLRTVVEGLTTIGGWLFEKLRGGVHAVAGTLVELGGWVIGKVVDGIRTVTDALLGVGGFIFRQIKESVGGFAEKLLDIGLDIVKGIIKGIASAPVDWVKDALKKVLPEPVEDLLKLGSPSRLAMGWGRDVMLGLIQGLGQVPVGTAATDAFQPLIDAAEELPTAKLEVAGLEVDPAAGASVADSLVDSLADAQGFVQGAGAQLVGWLAEGIQALPQGFAEAVLHIQKLFAVALTGIAPLFRNLGVNIVTWLDQGVVGIANGFSQAAGRIASLFKTALEGVAPNFRNRGADIVAWIGQGIEGVKDAFANAGVDIHGDIAGAISAQPFGEIGQNILTRIAQAMENLAAVWEKKPGDELVAFARSMVKAIRKALEFGSPSKPMLAVGRDLVDSVSKGMNDEDFNNFIKQWFGGLRGFMLDVGVKPIQEPFKFVMDALQLDVGAPGDPKIARTIAEVAKEFNASPKEVLAAFEAALAESGMRNLRHGDRDSLGVFQQRASQGWGKPEQILNPKYAATKFFERIKGADAPSAHQLAQAVQRSAFSDGSNYLAFQAEAAKWARRFGYIIKDLLVDIPSSIKRGEGRTHSPVTGEPKAGFFEPGYPAPNASATWYLNNIITPIARKFGLYVVSGYRPGDSGSFHGVDRGRDYQDAPRPFSFRGTVQDMMDFAEEMWRRFRLKLRELIYSPLGWSGGDGGQHRPPWSWDKHFNHVHVAMAKGGIVTSRMFAELGEAGKEAVVPLTDAVMRQLARAIVVEMEVPQVAIPVIRVPVATASAVAGAASMGTVQNFNIPPAAPGYEQDPEIVMAHISSKLRAKGGG